MRDLLQFFSKSTPRLAQALRSFIDELEDAAGVRLHLAVPDADLPISIALLTYHIAREGVTNALRHAASRDVWISVDQRIDEVVLTVRDHGIGFDTRSLANTHGTGLALMRERVAIGGGVLEIDSLPPAGTTVRVTFPV